MIMDVVFTVIGMVGIMSFIAIVACCVIKHTHYIELKEKYGELVVDLIVEKEQEKLK